MEEEAKLKELSDDLNKDFTSATQDCSNICRQIAFALTAVAWAIIFKGDDYKNNDWNVIYIKYVLIALVVYFLIDVCQYFLVAVRYRKHYRKTDAALQYFSIKEIEDIEAKGREKISNMSYYFFFVKIVVLLAAVIGLIVCIVL
ncbi:MAG: hypothetical protein LBR75_00540 [Prevotellaceae bacterium]|jgi:hypothetical protein|nr:hypothetical protein [Prevotellaceae bacterium]